MWSSEVGHFDKARMINKKEGKLHLKPYNFFEKQTHKRKGKLEDYTVKGMPIWCTLLVHENWVFVVSFYTIEESAKHFLRPFCNQCRCIGKARILFSLIVWFFNWVSVPSILDQFMSAGVLESQWTQVYWIICKTKDQITRSFLLRNKHTHKRNGKI